MKNLLEIYKPLMKIKFLFLFTLPLVSYSQNWIQSGVFPYSGVHHPITFSYNEYGYVVTGSNTNNTYRYDKTNDTWTQLSDFPGGDRGYAYGLQVGGKAYMGFGSTPNSTFPNDWWEYDIINDIWNQKADFPSNGRNHPAMVDVGGKIYVGCGSNSANLGDWWEYDINSDSWSQKADLPANDRHHPFYFSIDNYAYVGFGHGSVTGPGSNPSSSSYIYNDFYRYDPSSDTWLRMQDFPSEARVAGTQFSFNGKGYVLSGDGDNHGPLDSGELWEYNPVNDLWTQLPSHPGDAIWAPGNFVIDCDVYFLLGQNNNTIPPSYPLNIYKYKLGDACGCTDSNAVNYSVVAIIDDGTCCYVAGCTEPFALNYDPLSCFDDGSCIMPIIGCTNSTASNYNPLANTTVAFGGPIDNTFSTGGYFSGNQHLIFDAFDDCIIKSALFYSETNNTVTFELRDINGNVLDDTTHSLVFGSQRLDLNFNVPAGSDFQLGVAGNNSGLYRNNSGAIFPYNIGDIINITGSSANQSGYYYFYYSLEVEQLCLDVSSIEEKNNTKKLVKVFDLYGRELNNIIDTQVLFYLYEDGTVIKKFITK